MRSLYQAVRSLSRDASLSGFAVVTMMSAVAGATIVYSFAHGLLLRSYGYPNPERLVRLESRLLNQGSVRQGMALLDLDDYRSRASAIEDAGAFALSEAQLIGAGPAELVRVLHINAGALKALGVQPFVGRLPTFEEDVRGGDVHKALISYSLWTSRFSADSNVVGKSLRTDRLSYSIIGVMPPGFAFPGDASVWIPLESKYATSAGGTKRRGDRFYPAIARLREHVTIAEAEAELNGIAVELERTFPKENAGVRVTLTDLREADVGPLRPYVRALAGGVTLFVSVCASNLAFLLLMTAARHARDDGVRMALGAAPGTLVVPYLAKSTILCVCGGGLGIFAAYLGLKALVGLIPFSLPPYLRPELDWPVLGAIVGLIVVVAFVCATPAVLRAAKPHLNGALNDGSRMVTARTRARRAPLVVHVALTVGLLTFAGAFIRVFVELRDVDPGFSSDRLVTARVSKYEPGRPADRVDRVNQRHASIVGALEMIPGGTSAAFTTHLPYRGARMRGNVTVRRMSDSISVESLTVSDVTLRYFEVMGIRLLKGRLFNKSDTLGSRCVVIINDRAGRQYWPDSEASAPQLKFGSATDPFCDVIGVVSNVRQQANEPEGGVELYYPVSQWPFASGYYVVRMAGEANSALPIVRRTIAEAEPTAAVVDVRTMEGRMSDMLWRQRLWGVLFTAFACMALGVGAIGSYAVLAESVSKRRREIAIRLALGASRVRIWLMLVRDVIPAIAAAVALGSFGVWGLARTTTAVLEGAEQLQPLEWLVSVVVACFASLLGAAVPAYFGARADPLAGLRQQP